MPARWNRKAPHSRRFFSSLPPHAIHSSGPKEAARAAKRRRLPGAPVPGEGNGPQAPSDTFSTSLPKLRPSNSICSASGKFSRPSTTSSRVRKVPACIHFAISATAR